MKIAVLKFGGTSVAEPAGRQAVADKIRQALERGLNPVVVLSAMGRSPAPYATDSLIGLIEGEQRDPAELDMLMSCGEVISCVVMSHYLRAHGLPSAALDARRAAIFTSDQPGDARILRVEPTAMMALVAEGVIPVVAGFQGVDSAGSVTTLGRGGSDTTAVAIGAALRAHFVEIYTDVDGVMTADPRILPQAEVLSQINFEEMGELAVEGAKVVHPRAVALADDHGVPLWIKNTFGDGYGTFLSRAVPKDAFEKTRIITGIAHLGGLTQMVVEVGAGQRVALLDTLAEAGISLDLVNVTSSQVHCIVKDSCREDAAAILGRSGHRYQLRGGCTKISVVGAGMRGTPGVMAAVLGCLQKDGIEILHSTDSNITISCLIPSEQVKAAVGALHRRFLA